MAPEELETAVQRLVRSSLTRDFLPSNAFTVETLISGSTMTVFVYLSDTLLTTAQVSL